MVSSTLGIIFAESPTLPIKTANTKSVREVFKLKKIKMPNRPAMLFPTILVGADVNGRPNYCTVGACGVVSLEPMLYVSLKETHLDLRETGQIVICSFCVYWNTRYIQLTCHFELLLTPFGHSTYWNGPPDKWQAPGVGRGKCTQYE